MGLLSVFFALALCAGGFVVVFAPPVALGAVFLPAVLGVVGSVQNALTLATTGVPSATPTLGAEQCCLRILPLAHAPPPIASWCVTECMGIYV